MLTHQAMANFLQTVYNAILRLIPYESLRTIVLASPGFTKDTVGGNFSIC